MLPTQKSHLLDTGPYYSNNNVSESKHQYKTYDLNYL